MVKVGWKFVRSIGGAERLGYDILVANRPPLIIEVIAPRLSRHL